VGYTVEILCSDCKYRKVFNLGRSSTKEYLSEILKGFSVEVNSTVKQLDSAYGMIDYDYGDEVMTCNQCKEINTNLVFKVKFSNELEYTPKYFCSKCNAKLKSLETLENLNKCSCPNCGNLSLKYKDVCNWD
jgi:DNA-directed RNA polymerase subunit RPC12/RpoP